MKRSVLVAVLSILAGVGGFFFRQRQLDAQAASLIAEHRVTLLQAQKDLSENKFKSARDAASKLRQDAPEFESNDVASVLGVADREVQASALLEAGEKAVERDQLLAAHLAWESVAEGTAQKAAKNQLEAHLDVLVEQRFVRARQALDGDLDAVKVALFGVREVLAMKPHDETALNLLEGLGKHASVLGAADPDSGSTSESEIPEHRRRHAERLLGTPSLRESHERTVQIIHGRPEPEPDAGTSRKK